MIVEARRQRIKPRHDNGNMGLIIRLLQFIDCYSTKSNIRSTYGLTIATGLPGANTAAPSDDDELLMVARI